MYTEIIASAIYIKWVSMLYLLTFCLLFVFYQKYYLQTCKIVSRKIYTHCVLNMIYSCITVYVISLIYLYLDFYWKRMYIYLIFSLQVCKNEHVNHRWCSQPLLNMRIHTGDLMLASSTLISGNNFQKKIYTLAKFLKIPLLSSSTFYRIQRTYLVPSMDRFWMQQHDVLS